MYYVIVVIIVQDNIKERQGELVSIFVLRADFWTKSLAVISKWLSGSYENKTYHIKTYLSNYFKKNTYVFFNNLVKSLP